MMFAAKLATLGKRIAPDTSKVTRLLLFLHLIDLWASAQLSLQTYNSKQEQIVTEIGHISAKHAKVN